MLAIRPLVILASAMVVSQAPAAAVEHPKEAALHVEAGDEALLTTSMPALLRAVEAWLTSNFDLAAAPEQPRIARVPAARMAAIRNQAIVNYHARSKLVQVSRSPDVAAFYDDTTRTIHLPAGWTGATAAELSVLVHEMVHHLQNMAGARYNCSQAREALAFEAQQRWLALSGSSLEREFGLDRMTLLVNTRCMF